MSRFSGGVFHASLEGGRAGAQLQVDAFGLRAETKDKEQFSLSWSELRIERGGASGKMIFCRDAQNTLTLFCEEKGFLDYLAAQPGGQRHPELQALWSAAQRATRRTYFFLALGALLLVALGFGFMPGLRWMGGWVLRQMPTSIDRRLGDLGWAQMQGELSRMKAPKASAALEEIVQRLEVDREARRWKYRLYLVDDGRINAFALPGGRLVVFRGLLEAASGPEEVAGVLAHEMAHVSRRHGVQRLIRSVGLVGAIQVLIGDVGGVMALGKELLTLSAINHYSREQESEADERAVQVMQKAGLDALALAHFFERLQKEQGKVPEYLEWMSTHPSHRARIDSIRRALRGRTKPLRRPLALDWSEVQREVGKRPPPRSDAKAAPAGSAPEKSAPKKGSNAL